MSRLIERASCYYAAIALLGTASAAYGQAYSPPEQGGHPPSSSDGANNVEVTDDERRPWFRGVTREQRVSAREFFLAGNTFLRDGLFAPAVEQYRQALGLWRHPAFFYNLTIAQLSLVQPIEAHASILKALEHGKPGLGADKHERAVEYKTLLEKQLAKVVILCDEPGVQITLDGQPIELVAGRYEQVMLPGTHQVLAKKDKRIPEDRQVVVSSGERVQVELVLGIPDKVETVRYMPSWIPWTTLVLGAAVLGGAGYLDWHSSEELAHFDIEFDNRCRRGCLEPEVQGLTDQLTSAESEKRTAIGLYIAGGVVAVGGAVLVYVNRERIRRTKVKRKTFSLAPLFGRDQAGFSAALRF